MENLEYIDNYFTGTLTPEQKIAFEERVQSDNAFAEELTFYINSMHLLKQQANDEKKRMFRELYFENKSALSTQSPVISLHSPLRKLLPYAAAACLLIVIAGLWWFLAVSPGPSKLAGRYINHELTTLPVTMSSVQDSLQKGITLYNRGKMEDAQKKFQEILLIAPESIQARVYNGIVYLREKQYDSALTVFRQLKKDTTLYSNPALFYEALTLMRRNRAGDADSARLYLQQVIDSNLDKKEAAVQLLKQW